MSRPRRKGNPEQRKARAQERAERRAQLTPKQQLDRLDLFLGKGVGASKERARLKKQIEEGS